MAGIIQKNWKPKPAFQIDVQRIQDTQAQSNKGTGRFGNNPLSAWISELSGAGGATGGAALGASLGSVVPGIGTLIGGVAGGVLGGFTGGTAGRLAENQLRDRELRLREALGEGVVSGVLGGAGTAVQAARGLNALGKVSGGGVKAGLSELGTLGGKEATAAGKALLTGGKKAGQALATGFTEDLATAAKKTAGKNALERSGNQLYRNTLGIDDIKSPLKSGPKTLFKADELLGEAKSLRLKGAPSSMLRQVNTQYQRYNTKITGALAKNSRTTSLESLYNNAVDDITKKLPLSIDNVPVEEELTRSFNLLSSFAKNGKLRAKDIFKFKNELNVDSAFRKLSGDLASPLSAKESVDMALWTEADKWIAKLAPSAKELTMKQSKLYGLSQGLSKMTATSGMPNTVMEAATRAGGPLFYGTQAKIGRALTSAGNIAPNIPGVVPQLAKGVVARGAANQFTAPPSEFGGVEPNSMNQLEMALGNISSAQQPVEQQTSRFSQDQLDQAIMIDLQQTGGQNLATIQKIAELYGPQSTGGGAPNVTKVTAQQLSLAERGKKSLNQLSDLLQKDPSVLTRSALPGRKLPVVGGFISQAAGTGQFDAIGYNVASALLRLETGAQANESEIRNLQTELMPRAGDSPETINQKLQQLGQAFDTIINAAYQGGA